MINGFDCTKNPLEAKRQAAYVSENVMLYGNFTALQNLEFFGKLSWGAKESPDLAAFAITSWITCSTLLGEMKYLRSLGSK